MSLDENAPDAGCNRPEGSDSTTIRARTRGDVVAPIVRDQDAGRLEHWRACALVALDRLALAGRPFTAADVTAAVGAPCPSPALLGGLLAGAHRRGQLALVGACVDVRAIGTPAPTRLWAGVAVKTSGSAA